MITIQDLEKNYQDFHLQCSLEIKKGMVTGLIGANGAGKSTLFKAILGLISVDGGTATIFGKDFRKITPQDKNEIGVVLAEGGFSTYLTIRKIIPIMKSLYKGFHKDAFIKQCEHFQLPLDKQIKDMSTGMRAKLKLLIAMSHDAKLLILDEPTAGLDVLAREELLDMMRAYMEPGNRSIVISSHISSDLEGLCDELYMIHDGRIILHEDADVLLDGYGVLKMTPEQYAQIDKKNLCYVEETRYGYHCLTRDKQFFMDNYPQFVIEKGNVDEILTIVEKGQRV